jgi:CRP-like cAMP-binding protein
MTDEMILNLKKASLFRDLPESLLAALADKVTKERLEPGQVLFRKGDIGDALYVIDDGRVKIVTENAKGGELVLNECGPGEAIGDMSLIDLEPRSASVIAITSAELLQLKRDDFLEVLKSEPSLALDIMRRFSARLRYNTTYIEKAIAWSQRIAEGDYSFADQIRAESEQAVSNEDKASQLLSAFFQLVQGVKGREDELKQQLQKLTLEIDEVRRKQEFEDLTSTDFYANLKAQAAKLRQQRLDNQ